MFRRGMPVNAKLVGVAVSSVALASLLFAFVSHKGLPGRSYTYATAAVAEVPAGLKAGDEVRVKGVRVGQVHGISYEDGGPRIEMQLPGDLEMHGDARARIRSRSTLGQKYVDVDPGTEGAGPLGDGIISLDRTESLVELDQLFDTLDAPTREALGSAVRELGGGAAGHGRDLNDLMAASPDLLADFGTTFGGLSEERTRLVAFLAASERLAGRFAGREAELERLIGEMGETFDALAVDAGEPLRETLDRLPPTLEAVEPALGDVGRAAAELRGGVSGFAPAAEALGEATPDLRAATREAVPTLRASPPVNELAAPAFAALAGTFNDARPLAPQLRRGLGSAAQFLSVLAPYAPELDLLFDHAAEALSQGDRYSNYLRIVSISLGADGGGALVPADNPFVNRNAYPEPGEAATDANRFEQMPGGRR